MFELRKATFLVAKKPTFLIAKKPTLLVAAYSITPQDGDYLKNQTISATYYDGFGWFGDITTLDPLDGYMLKSGKISQLIYPAGQPEPKSQLENQNLRDQSNQFVPFSPQRFEFSGQVNASVSIEGQTINDPNNQLFTFFENQVLGISQGLVFPPTGEYIFAHMSHNNAKEGRNLSFCFYDASDQQWYGFEESLTFSADMIEADAYNPFKLEHSFKIEAPDFITNDLIQSLHIFPNPANNFITVDLELAKMLEIKLEILDSSGRIVRSIDQGKLSEGKHALILDIHDLSNGLYCVRPANLSNLIGRFEVTK